MDTNKRKTGLARLIEIAGTKRRLLIGAMLLAVVLYRLGSFLRFRSAHVCFPHALAHCRFQHSV